VNLLQRVKSPSYLCTCKPHSLLAGLAVLLGLPSTQPST
jgi:hypothetical protein